MNYKAEGYSIVIFAFLQEFEGEVGVVAIGDKNILLPARPATVMICCLIIL
jgi:hypothetical protein